MDNIKDIQSEFFETLSSIQETAVNVALGEYHQKDSLEDLLYNATYETITQICELLDGYKSDTLQLDLIDRNSKISLRTNIELHDACADYLKWEDPYKK